MSSTNEERLTRAEWELAVAREQCGIDGHDFTVFSPLGEAGPLRVSCGRCGRVWPIVTELMKRDLEELSRAFTIASEEIAVLTDDGQTELGRQKRAGDVRRRIREEAREVRQL